jgi:erythromycin esterase
VFAAAVLTPGGVRAQTPSDLRESFRSWAERALHPIDAGSIDSATDDLRPVRTLVGASRIVALSEPVHGAAEPLEFRNRLFKYLVQELGFTAIALESGVVEGRVLNDYIVDGKGDLDTAAQQGLSWTFDAFPQNRALMRWMRDYNAHLPRGQRKLQLYGFDVAGSPGNLAATRGPDTALEVALAYLRTVDPQPAAAITSKVAAFLPTMKASKYEHIAQTDRDSITTAIEDLISLLEHRKFQYLSRSAKDDYEWAERAAIAARQAHTWWRHMPIGWKTDDGFEWMRDASQTRERAMADNLSWIADRLGARERILVYAAVSHIATAPLRFTDAPERDMFPFGTYAKARFGSDLVALLTLVNGGEIAFCSANERKPVALKPPPSTSIEALFTAVATPRYVLDFRSAPAPVTAWLNQPQDHWNGFGITRFAAAQAFDAAYFVRPLSPACPPR